MHTMSVRSHWHTIPVQRDKHSKIRWSMNASFTLNTNYSISYKTLNCVLWTDRDQPTFTFSPVTTQGSWAVLPCGTLTSAGALVILRSPGETGEYYKHTAETENSEDFVFDSNTGKRHTKNPELDLAFFRLLGVRDGAGIKPWIIWRQLVNHQCAIRVLRMPALGDISLLIS